MSRTITIEVDDITLILFEDLQAEADDANKSGNFGPYDEACSELAYDCFNLVEGALGLSHGNTEEPPQ